MVNDCSFFHMADSQYGIVKIKKRGREGVEDRDRNTFRIVVPKSDDEND